MNHFLIVDLVIRSSDHIYFNRLVVLQLFGVLFVSSVVFHHFLAIFNTFSSFCTFLWSFCISLWSFKCCHFSFLNETWAFVPVFCVAMILEHATVYDFY